MGLKRKELVQTSTTPTVTKIETKEYTQEGKWNHCYLSQKKLAPPIVSDHLGRLYNKESVLELLVDPSKFSQGQRVGVKHITSLKDIVELKIKQRNGNGRFICSVTGELLGSGSTKAVYLVECGDVFLEKCLKFDDSLKCPVCQVSYDKRNAIVLNSTDEESIKKLEDRLTSLKKDGLSHSLKKSKSNKRKKHIDQPSTPINIKKPKI
ncbi:hypothetical protein WICPIJ_004486 [Wickerhamomyces pijperi]|uniref:Replication termination factor 2 n=1 Tax=Wickerhamomyces pijperi TaxID=599730 RepID=A0A9P8Q5S7_WICPI|nr:hypothetical protein WICPIJ_004486 [Wickerhamomyces pijperi]